MNQERTINNGHQQLLTAYAAIVEQSPQGIALLEGPAFTIAIANDPMLEIWDKSRAVIGMPVMRALPEFYDQSLEDQLQVVYRTGESRFANGVHVRLRRHDHREDHYFDFSYSAVRTPEGDVRAVLVMARDSTRQHLAGKQVADSEWLLKTALATAPAAIGVFMGRDLKVGFHNQTFIDIVGKGPDIEGKPLREVMPELTTENQPFLRILDDVYTSGKMFRSFGARVDIVQQGVMTHNYYNITYTPLFDKTGNVFAILDIAVDVTGEVIARKQLEAIEGSLLAAVDVAELGTWSFDFGTQSLTFSERIIEWFGFDDNPVSLDSFLNSITDDERSGVQDSFVGLVAPASKGLYDREFTIVQRITGRRRILRVQGKVIYDDRGSPSTISGIARDVTIDRKVQMALEEKIQERTSELASAAEELRVANEDLSISNELLSRSNDDLQRFAHVASHDLREPLRKIKTFLSRINQDDVSFNPETARYLKRINVATDRMWDMINGVLAYSTVAAGHHPIQTVDLNAVVQSVLVDLELVISGTKANIEMDRLPEVEGIPVLLHQLFYNLITNALKFIHGTRTPLIRIAARTSNAGTLEIRVIDNGIGFDPKYAEEIFDTFTRLNSKDIFEGTGLGLSLCRRIAERHHGNIRAESAIGEGTTFIVTLPRHQQIAFV